MARRLAVTGLALGAIALTQWASPAAARAEAPPSASASAVAPASSVAAPASASAAATVAPSATAPTAATAAPPLAVPAPTAAPVAAATGATPLTVRASHPVTYAADPAHASLGWKLGLIALGLGGGFWFWKRRAPKGAAPAPRIRIVARQSVGVRSEILIVEIEGDRLLLGVTPQSIARIGDLPPEGFRELDREPARDLGFEAPDARRDERDERDARGGERDVALRTGVSAYAREQSREVPASRDERDVRASGAPSQRRDMSARISALLGNPQLEPAPVITTRGARGGRGARAATREALVLRDDRDEPATPQPVAVEEQARGLLRAGRRP